MDSEPAGASGARPAALLHYATTMAANDTALRDHAAHIETALARCLATCTEFPLPAVPRDLGQALHAYATQTLEHDAWVGHVGLAFQLADSGIPAVGHLLPPPAADQVAWLGQMDAVLRALHAAGAQLPAPAAGALPGGPLYDADGTLQRLDLTMADFEHMTAAERIRWVEALEHRANTSNWFHNIQDIIAFFDESPTLHHMARGSWASWADAGVLEAMQNGFVLSKTKGHVPAGFNHCGGAADAWQRFFDAHNLKAPENKLLPLWAMAEQQGVNYGVATTDRLIGTPPVGSADGDLIRQFTGYGNFYRFIARIENGGVDFTVRYGGNVAARAGSTVGTIMTAPTWIILELLGATDEATRVREIASAAGGSLGREVSTWFTPELGDAVFDPRTLLVPLDVYADSSRNPARVDEVTFMTLGGAPGVGDLFITHGPTFYLGQGVEAGIVQQVVPADIHLDPVTGAITLDNGTQVLPSGRAILRDGTVITPDGWVIKPDGTRIPLEGTRFTADGSYRLSDGTVAR